MAFVEFHLITNIFPQLLALSIGNISLQNCYSESFTTNSYFLLKMQKFSPTDVFPFTATVLNNILLLLTQNHLPIGQASSSFKLLDTCMLTYAITIFITEVFCLVTQVQLFLMNVTVN